MEQDKQPLPQEREPVPGFPPQTLDEIREEIRKRYPTLTEEEWISICPVAGSRRICAQMGDPA
jgi:hypothetical protein